MLKDGRWVVYYREFRPDGKPYLKREYFGRGPQAEASARAKDKSLNLGARRPQTATAEGPTFAEIAREYFNSHRFASPGARDQHRLRMVSRLLPFFGPLAATRVADADLDRYIAARRRDVTDSTIRRELVDLKAIFNFSARRRPPLIAFNPVRDYRIPRETLEIIMPPTDAEFSAIMDHAPEHLRRILLLSYYLGLRPGPVECYRLRWENCDFGANTILIHGAKKGGPVKRLVPIHPDLMPLMRRWRSLDADRGIPWVIHWGGKTINKIATAWANALENAGITRRLRPYDMRHLFVTRALERGADIKPLAEIVGSRPETLMRFYQHVSAAAHRHTVGLIPPAPGNNAAPIKLSPKRNIKRCNI
jgi:integrase